MTCDAPHSFASSNLESCKSTAMIGYMEELAAACIIFKPTPPDPKTTIDSPILTLALFSITPKPVKTAQPKREATS